MLIDKSYGHFSKETVTIPSWKQNFGCLSSGPKVSTTGNENEDKLDVNSQMKIYLQNIYVQTFYLLAKFSQ